MLIRFSAVPQFGKKTLTEEGFSFNTWRYILYFCAYEMNFFSYWGLRCVGIKGNEKSNLFALVKKCLQSYLKLFSVLKMLIAKIPCFFCILCP